MKPDNATIKDVTWTSSDDTVLTVSASGLVTALKEGTATITATGFGDVKGTCSITVAAAAPASLTVETPETLSIFDGTGSARVTSVVRLLFQQGEPVAQEGPEHQQSQGEEEGVVHHVGLGRRGLRVPQQHLLGPGVEIGEHKEVQGKEHPAPFPLRVGHLGPPGSLCHNVSLLSAIW